MKYATTLAATLVLATPVHALEDRSEQYKADYREEQQRKVDVMNALQRHQAEEEAAKKVWQLEEHVDELTDVMQYYAYIGSGPSTRHEYMAVKCYPGLGHMEIHAAAGEYLGLKDSDVHVRYRIDKNDLLSHTWTAAPNGTTAYIIDRAAGRFARKLLDGEQIVMELAAYDDETHRVKFTLEGATEHVMTVLDACGETPEQAEARRIAEETEAERKRKKAAENTAKERK